ncbi:MAG TPA: SAM-dependent methyltransferase [Dehalococcoidia bacterium]|nr:SAM-dependent methyltransferase [Dehalococcoidia bacterium]
MSPEAAGVGEAIPDGLLSSEAFIDLVVKPARGERWRKVTVRPVMVKGRRVLQFSYLDERQDKSSNHDPDAAEKLLDQLLEWPVRSIVVRTRDEDITLRRSKRGRMLLTRAPAPEERAVSERHDRDKQVPLPAGKPDALLIDLGVMDPSGRVRPSMHDKHAQVNQFLQLLEQGLKKIPVPDGRPLRIVDLGCGSSYLTFAAYHYLNDIKGSPATITGVDLETKLIDKCSVQRDQLDYADLRFEKASIIDYRPPEPPDVVLALHACDTATDEALAQAVRWETKLILAAPCCHKELNARLESPGPLKAALRHGLLKERTADIVTDAFRAQLLRLAGYRTDVIEFIAAEHTAKNLMIRAVRTGRSGEPKVRREYDEMKAFWGVTPYLEGLLSEVRLEAGAGGVE